MTDAHRLQVVDSELRFESRTDEKFSRIAFALELLDILRPRMDVTLYEGRRRIKIRRGRDWSLGPDASWALIGIPPDASRQHIAFALAELVGLSHSPFVVDLLARANERTRDVAV